VLRALTPPAERAAAWLLVAGLYLAHLVYGAVAGPAPLVLALAEGLALALLLVPGWGRRSLPAPEVIRPPAIAFGLVLVAALWSLTPFVPGGAHPAWSYVGHAGSASLQRDATVAEIAKLLGAACLVLAGFVVGRSDERARSALNALLWIGAAYALWTLVLFLTGGQHYETTRLNGGLPTSNIAGGLFAVLAVLAGAAALSAAERREPGAGPFSGFAAAGPGWALVGLFLTCLVLTASRGAAAACGAAFLLLFGLEAWAGRIRLRTAAILAGVGLLVVALQGALLVGRAGQHDPTWDGRTWLFGAHWRAFQDSPLFGYGLGGFDAVNRLYFEPKGYAYLASAEAAHNVYLQWLEEAGLVGALPMFACIGLLLYATVRGMVSRRRSKTLLRGLLAASLVFLLTGFTDFALQTPSMAALWAMLLGLQLGLANASTARAA
jgi:O-antigen ligase